MVAKISQVLKSNLGLCSFIMAQGEPVTSHIEPVPANATPRRSRILLAVVEVFLRSSLGTSTVTFLNGPM